MNVGSIFFTVSRQIHEKQTKKTAMVIVAAMIEGKDNTNNSNENDKDENSRSITNGIYLSTLPLFNTWCVCGSGVLCCFQLVPRIGDTF